uniref:Uncharacterized protein n=1 Tax=Solanum lycopersicum TaxID=4081 RepID=A0A3Q7F1C2_SOLLC
MDLHEYLRNSIRGHSHAHFRYSLGFWSSVSSWCNEHNVVWQNYQGVEKESFEKGVTRCQLKVEQFNEKPQRCKCSNVEKCEFCVLLQVFIVLHQRDEKFA